MPDKYARLEEVDGRPGAALRTRPPPPAGAGLEGAHRHRRDVRLAPHPGRPSSRGSAAGSPGTRTATSPTCPTSEVTDWDPPRLLGYTWGEGGRSPRPPALGAPPPRRRLRADPRPHLRRSPQGRPRRRRLARLPRRARRRPRRGRPNRPAATPTSPAPGPRSTPSTRAASGSPPRRRRRRRPATERGRPSARQRAGGRPRGGV